MLVKKIPALRPPLIKGLQMLTKFSEGDTRGFYSPIL